MVVYGAGIECLTTDKGKYGEQAFGLVDPITGDVFTDGTSKAIISNYELISLPFDATNSAVQYIIVME